MYSRFLNGPDLFGPANLTRLNSPAAGSKFTLSQAVLLFSFREETHGELHASGQSDQRRTPIRGNSVSAHAQRH